MFEGRIILKILKVIKTLQWVFFVAAVIILFAITSFAEELEDVSRLQDYSKPLLCKRVVNGVIMSNDTFIVTWAELDKIKNNKMWFFHDSRIIKIGKGDSYVCTLVGS